MYCLPGFAEETIIFKLEVSVLDITWQLLAVFSACCMRKCTLGTNFNNMFLFHRNSQSYKIAFVDLAFLDMTETFELGMNSNLFENTRFHISE